MPEPTHPLSGGEAVTASGASVKPTGRYPTLYEALHAAFRQRGVMGPEEAADLADAVVGEWHSGGHPVCNCGQYVALCQHHQPGPSAPTSEAVESALLDEESPVYTAVKPRSTDA